MLNILIKKIFFKKQKNKIILHKANGQTKVVSKLNWLKVTFKGENSIVEVY